MKKYVALCLMVLLLFATGCSNQASNSEDQKAVMASYMDLLKAGDFEKAKPYLTEVTENFDYNENPLMKALFAKMSYSIEQVDATGKGAKAQVKISIPDTTIIYDSMMEEIGEEVQKLGGGGDDDRTKASEMMVTYMMAKLTSDEVVMVENTVAVELTTVDGKTLIVPNDDFSKALSGIKVQ